MSDYAVLRLVSRVLVLSIDVYAHVGLVGRRYRLRRACSSGGLCRFQDFRHLRVQALEKNKGAHDATHWRGILPADVCFEVESFLKGVE